MNFLNALYPLRLYREAKRCFGTTVLRSWCWNGSEITAETLKEIRREPEKYGTTIWKTSSKRVCRINVPGSDIVLAYKCSKPRPPARYLFLLSPSAREMINFFIFAKLGIPLVQMFAGGEDRKFGIPPENCWVMTRFAEDYLCGFELMPHTTIPKTTNLAEDPVIRADFLRFNMPLIAKLHNAGCYHRGFRPYNIMFRRLADGRLDCLWLDIASCVFYPLPDIFLKSMFLNDLKKFFHSFQATAEELELAADIYLQNCGRLHLTREELVRKLR